MDVKMFPGTSRIEAYPSRLLLGYEMTRTLEEYIGEVSFLMNNPRELTLVIEPRSGRFPREPLDTSERRILNNHYVPNSTSIGAGWAC